MLTLSAAVLRETSQRHSSSAKGINPPLAPGDISTGPLRDTETVVLVQPPTCPCIVALFVEGLSMSSPDSSRILVDVDVTLVYADVDTDMDSGTAWCRMGSSVVSKARAGIENASNPKAMTSVFFISAPLSQNFEKSARASHPLDGLL